MNAAEIIKLFDDVVSKLQAPAKQVVALYIKQIVAYGVVDIVVATIMIILGIVINVVIFKSKDQWGDCECIFFFLALVLLIWGIALAIHGGLLLYNPTYYLIQDLINS